LIKANETFLKAPLAFSYFMVVKEGGNLKTLPFSRTYMALAASGMALDLAISMIDYNYLFFPFPNKKVPWAKQNSNAFLCRKALRYVMAIAATLTDLFLHNSKSMN